MEFPITRNRQISKPLDSEFASLFGGIPHVNFETEEDKQLEAQIAAEVARLLIEEGGNEAPPRTPNINPFEARKEEDEIAPITTKASRRKRTIGAERPNTAPMNKSRPIVPASSTGFDPRPSTVTKEVASSSGFVGTEFYPLTPIEEEPKKPQTAQLTREENLSPRSLKLKLLEKEMANAQEEREKSIIEQQKRLQEQFNQELEGYEKDYQNSLIQMKEWFDSRKISIDNVKSQQEKIANLAQIVSKHSQTISSLSNKFGKDKEYSEDIKTQELLSKERALEARESRLLTQLQLLDQEKQRLIIKQKNIEEMDERYRKIIDEQKVKIFEEQKSMNELQVTMKQQDREKKQILALEQHRLSLLEEQIERDEKSVTEEILNKEKEIKEKENLMDIEKNEAYAQIQFEKNLLQTQISQFENFKRSIPTVNADLNKRISICEEKSKQIRYESENIVKAQEMLDKDKGLFEKEAQKIHQICLEIDKETEALMDQKAELERKKKEIEVKRQDVLTIISKSRQDKQRVDQLKSSLSNRMRVYESLKSPPKRIEIPKLDAIEPEIEQPISRYQARPRSVISRSNFRASDYMKDLEQYSNARDEIQTYIAYEGVRLLNSKLDYETGVNNGLQASIHSILTPTSSNYGKYSNSLNFGAGSFARPGDSGYIGSSFYKDNF